MKKIFLTKSKKNRRVHLKSMKYLVFLFPLLVSCVSMKTITLEQETSADEEAVALSQEYVENIPEVDYVQCTGSKNVLKQVAKLKEKENKRHQVVSLLGKPQYASADYLKEQTAIYSLYNKKQKAWCHIVVVTYSKNLVLDRLSIFSGYKDQDKIGHVFK